MKKLNYWINKNHVSNKILYFQNRTFQFHFNELTLTTGEKVTDFKNQVKMSYNNVNYNCSKV